MTDQNWRSNEPRIRVHEDAAPMAKKGTGGGGTVFAAFGILVLACVGAWFYLSKNAPLSLPLTNVTTSENKQPYFTMDEFERWYGNWDVDSWNDDLNAVEIHTWGWLNSGKEQGRKESTICLAPEDYRALKAVALTKNRFNVEFICRGVRDERAKK